MYGKISAILMVVAYLLPPITFIYRKNISLFILKWKIKLGVIKVEELPLLNNPGIKVLILFAIVSVISAVTAIVLGHYSKGINEDYGVWLNYVIGLGYVYLSLLVLIFFAFKNFSLSGYR